MAGEIEAIGDVVTGALAGRVVEPEAGEGKTRSGDICLNCGLSLVGAHCHGCGQKAKVHRTLGAFGHDILHSVLHFDGKIWHTLPLLAWRPGDLTRRYIHGERARFVSPLALFLFTVFLTFAVFSRLVPSNLGDDAPVAGQQAAKALASEAAEINADIKQQESDRKEALADGDLTAKIDTEIAKDQENLKALEAKAVAAQAKVAAWEHRFDAPKQTAHVNIAKLEGQLAAARAAGQPTGKIDEKLTEERAGLKMIQAASDLAHRGSADAEDSNWNFTDLHFTGSGALNASVKHAIKNPQLFIYKVQSNAYKFSWALIPISTPFLWLLFAWRRKFKLFDHAVFVTYSLCFMMALASVCALLIQFPATEVVGGLGLSLLPPVHMYRQLKQAYGLSRFGAIWRMLLLSGFALTALSLFAVLIVALGATA